MIADPGERPRERNGERVNLPQRRGVPTCGRTKRAGRWSLRSHTPTPKQALAASRPDALRSNEVAPRRVRSYRGGSMRVKTSPLVLALLLSLAAKGQVLRVAVGGAVPGFDPVKMHAPFPFHAQFITQI